MNVQVGKKVIDFIFAEETGGRDYYDKYGAHPYWPKGASGITLGGGYDCGYNSPEAIKNAWGGLLSDAAIHILQGIAGLKGQKAANALTPAIINAIHIPYEMAYQQYTNRVIKGEVALTIHTFPQAEKLNPDTIGVLTSIVYNRGSAMQDKDPKTQDRREMRAIRDLVPKMDYKGIAAQINSMKRLWDGVPDYVGDHEQRMIGLVNRRGEEATLVLQSERIYQPSEIITFSI